jgi:hypothetical protein
MAVCKGLDRGWERRCRGSEEDLMMAQRLRGGLDDGTGSEEVDNGADSRENFVLKFWQTDGVSQSLRGLGFAKAVQ